MVFFAALALANSYQAFGFPIADGPKDHRVQVRQHDIRTTILDGVCEVKGLTVLRNDGDKAVKLRVIFPRIIHLPELREFEPFPVTYLVDGRPWFPKQVTNFAPPSPLPIGDQWCPEGAELEFGPKQTRSIRTSHLADLGGTKDEFQGQLIYDLSGVPTWNGAAGQTNFSYKYTQNEVFNLPTIKGYGWQIGLTGAFLRAEGMQGGGRISFVFYRTPKN